MKGEGFMSEWTQIMYREFYDVPRAVIARNNGFLYFFDSRFDENLDCYLDHYEVWRLPLLSNGRLADSWVGLEKLALERLPDIGLRDLPFEVSHRNTPDADASRDK
jgi:hypothetical protein